MKGTEEVMIFLVYCIRLMILGSVLFLLALGLLGFSDKIVHHLVFSCIGKHIAVLEKACLHACLRSPGLSGGGKLKWPLPSSWPLCCMLDSYCRYRLYPAHARVAARQQRGTLHQMKGGAVAGHSPATAGRPPRPQLTP